MTYSRISVAATCVCWLLCLCLLTTPGLIYWLFQIPAHDSADFLAKRAAMLFLGLGVMTFLSRQSNNSETQRILSAGMMAGMSGLAMLGLFEYLRGMAGPGMWLAICAELGFVMAYLRVYRRASQA
ncbi:hypothetical protein [Aestuariibius sp. HNIBRBA575]|uniref:hypothetical protein n=1 Tax=Aestuariibius sp. HNIBRBA575 TaxID=3233343 RepID=UPI0034A20646